MDKILCFCLTEPQAGSDASHISTTATKTEGGWLINGRKKWQGNGTFADYHLVWAINTADEDKIQCFVVSKGSPGLHIKQVENNYSMRMVEYGDMKYENVFVPDHNKLTHAVDFMRGTKLILEQSRIHVAFAAAGIAAGAYESAIKYCLKRKQFGRPIASF
jgi:alkylation response protein AidB-like acyl-CoA dehydrogenase